MSSDYEFSDDDNEYYDGMDMDDDEEVEEQDDGKPSRVSYSGSLTR